MQNVLCFVLSCVKTFQFCALRSIAQNVCLNITHRTKQVYVRFVHACGCHVSDGHSGGHRREFARGVHCLVSSTLDFDQ